MPTDAIRSNLPPTRPMPPAGTQTSNRWGTVISTRPLPAPAKPVTNPSGAPTCDRWGNIISTPVNTPVRTTPIPGTNYVPNASGVVAWK